VRRRPLILTAFLLSVAGIVLVPAVAQAQVSLNPTVTPTKFTGGWVYAMAIGLFGLGAIIALVATVSYMRFAPRFARQEGHGPAAGARAERIVEGKPPPRRPVEMRESAPVLVPPPVTEAAAPPAQAAPPAPAPAAPAAPAKPAAEKPAEKPADEKPAEETPAADAPAPPASATAQPSAGSTEPKEPAPEAAAQPAAQAPASHSGPVEQDQETFDRVLQEQLSKGVDRRVAEGRAKSAAVVAARKKAGG
jgi:outer membrane biosynthesis protein TonB